MKSLLGALALVTLMGAGAWSSDALTGFDAPDEGRHQKQHAEDRAAEKAEKTRARADKKAEKKADRAQPRDEGEDGAEEKPAKPDHPHGGAPGQQQRGSTEPPAWSGGPEKRTEEPPGIANKPADHPAKTHGRP